MADNTNQQLTDEVRRQWDQKAAFWNRLHGEHGNRFHRELVSPAVERLLDLRPGERVLDIACGSGMLARRLASLGAHVTAVDFSSGQIEQAKQYEQTEGPQIDYAVVDAADSTQLLQLGRRSFDAITCTMALMDIADIEPLFTAAAELLTADGRFVFATAHPAFNSNSPIFVAEQIDDDGALKTIHSLKLSGYLEMPPQLAVGARGEPTAHYYFHRPLHALLAPAFANNLVLDALEEPAYPFDPAARPLSWYSYHQFPPVLAGRLRLLQR